MEPDRIITYPADAMDRVADVLCDIDWNLSQQQARDYAYDIVTEVTEAVDKLRALEARESISEMEARDRELAHEDARSSTESKEFN